MFITRLYYPTSQSTRYGAREKGDEAAEEMEWSRSPQWCLSQRPFFLEASLIF